MVKVGDIVQFLDTGYSGYAWKEGKLGTIIAKSSSSLYKVKPLEYCVDGALNLSASEFEVLPIQVGDTVTYKNCFNQKLHGGKLEVLAIKHTGTSGIYVKQIEDGNWDFYISLDTAIKVEEKKEMTQFKKGDLVKYESSDGTRYGVFDRLQGSNMAYAFWADSIEEAKKKTYSTWVDIYKVSKLGGFAEGDIIKSGSWYNEYRKVLEVGKYGYIVTDGEDTEFEAKDNNEPYDFVSFDAENDYEVVVLKEDKVKELTLKEVAERLDIPVAELRIKD